MSARTPTDAQIADISAKIEVERKVLQGASAMYRQLADPQAREACEANMVESKRRLEYLEGMLRDVVAGSMLQQPQGKLQMLNGPQIPPRSSSGSQQSIHSSALQASSVANLFKFGRAASADQVAPTGSGSMTPQIVAAGSGAVHTAFDLLKYGSAITTEKVKYRLQEIMHKLDTEQKVKTGTENLLHAMFNLNNAGVDQKVANELKDKMAESNAKIAVLEKAKHRYSALYVAPPADDQEEPLAEIRRKCNGRLRLKLIGASNLVGRTAAQNEIIATVAIDGNSKYTSRRSSTRWDETLDVQVDRAQEVEICVYSHPGGMLLGLVWFKLGDLEEELRTRYPNGVPPNVNDVDDTWLDLEPAGQILIRSSFVGMAKAKTQKDAVFRRGAVQKAFPRNGHKFYAVQSLLYQCAVCNEFSGSGTQWYQCQGCNYTCHAKCYSNVITKCITPSDIKNASPDTDLNTGQLLPYRIPHRFQPKKILLTSWCSHCGSMMGPGARIEKCAECGKCAHSHCKPMVPNFCQLKPEVAITLVAAFEDVERRKVLKEMEEAERAEKARREADAVAAAAMPVVANDPFKEDESDRMNENARQLELLHLEQQRKEKEEQERRSQLDQKVARAEAERARAEEERVRKQEEQRKAFERQQREKLEEKKRLDEARLAQQQQQQQQANLKIPAAVHRNVKLEDFDFLSVLGRGAFGKVMLIEEKSTKQLFAMKALKKEFIIQSDDVASAKLEKRIFQKATQSQHPFLVNLHSCFQTDTRLYFVMEYVSGGDLMCHIQEKKRFSQVRAKFYACEVLLALDFFHKNNIVYRDLKLDNIVMCPDGHVKVIDYGICKENMPYGMVTRTYCGTPDYMAPEILSQQKYGRAVDWWSYGVLIYVMLVGRYPFHGDDESDILEAILSDTIDYPSNMPKETLNLIQGLLNKDPKRRLGGGRLDAEEVKRHPYFAGVDWDAFMERSVGPPWKPIIKNEKDVSNFDSEFTKEKPVLTPIASVLSSVHQAEFKDFDFVAEWAGGSNSALNRVAGGNIRG
ncbi:kinase-like domain-containing protein [Chytriomyces cf. hyalinus JEL632]|nr:kinase-like domain-containing protein [Chytriomyces cf. hyalinus JEL632]